MVKILNAGIKHKHLGHNLYFVSLIDTIIDKLIVQAIFKQQYDFE